MKLYDALEKVLMILLFIGCVILIYQGVMILVLVL